MHWLWVTNLVNVHSSSIFKMCIVCPLFECVAARNHTSHVAHVPTDPQIPMKSKGKYCYCSTNIKRSRKRNRTQLRSAESFIWHNPMYSLIQLRQVSSKRRQEKQEEEAAEPEAEKAITDRPYIRGTSKILLVSAVNGGKGEEKNVSHSHAIHGVHRTLKLDKRAIFGSFQKRRRNNRKNLIHNNNNKNRRRRRRRRRASRGGKRNNFECVFYQPRVFCRCIVCVIVFKRFFFLLF